jgi:hypothetical protein
MLPNAGSISPSPTNSSNKLLAAGNCLINLYWWLNVNSLSLNANKSMPPSGLIQLKTYKENPFITTDCHVFSHILE